MSSRSAVPAFVGIFLLAVSASMTQALGTEPVSLSATATEDAVEIELEGHGPDGQAYVVLHHADAEQERAIDKIVQVPLRPAERTRVVLQDVRPSVDATVSILPATDPVPLRNGTSLIDPQALLEGSSLAQAEVKAPDAAPSHPHVFQGYPIARIESGSSGQVAVTPEGLVVANVLACCKNVSAHTLQFAVSRDAGHTFGPLVNVTDRVTNEIGSYHWALTKGGQVFILYQTFLHHGDGSAAPLGTRYAVLDPGAASVWQDEAWRYDFPLGRASNVAAAIDDGVWVAGKRGMGVEVWRLGPAGHPALMATLPTDSGEIETLEVAASLNQVLVVWLERNPQRDLTLRWARSFDGGRTFSEPARVAGLEDARFYGESLSLAANPAGAFHWTVLVHRGAERTDWPRGSAHAAYFQLAASSAAPELRWVSGGPNPVSTRDEFITDPPLVLVRDARVWLFFTHEVPLSPNTSQALSYAAESIDGGSTFSAAFATQNVHGWPILCPCGGDTFPDGRPILSGSYAYGHTDVHPSIMPYFDPLPMVETRTVSLQAGSLPVALPALRFTDAAKMPTASPNSDGSPAGWAPGAGVASMALALGALSWQMRVRRPPASR